MSIYLHIYILIYCLLCLRILYSIILLLLKFPRRKIIIPSSKRPIVFYFISQNGFTNITEIKVLIVNHLPPPQTFLDIYSFRVSLFNILNC